MPEMNPSHEPLTTSIGAIADRLRNRDAWLDFVLHVDSVSRMTEVVAGIRQSSIDAAVPPWELPEVVTRGLREGWLRISSERPLPEISRHQTVRLSEIPASARTSVISMPPYCIAHTPGLFEGTLMRRRVVRSPSVARPVGRRMSP